MISNFNLLLYLSKKFIKMSYVIFFLLLGFASPVAEAQCPGPLEYVQIANLPSPGVHPCNGTIRFQPGDVTISTDPTDPANVIPVQVTYSGGGLYSKVDFWNDPPIVFPPGYATPFPFCSGSPTITLTFSQPVTDVAFTVEMSNLFASTDHMVVTISGGGTTLEHTLGLVPPYGRSADLTLPGPLSSITFTGSIELFILSLEGAVSFRPVISPTPVPSLGLVEPCQIVPTIQSVLLENLDGSALELNPILNNEIIVNNVRLGGGLRVFPDAASSDPMSPDSQPRRTIRVTATIIPAQRNVRVYFRSFDVDDSSGLFSSAAHNGQDNQEAVVRLNGFPKEGFFMGFPNGTVASALTGANGMPSGMASVEFNVSMQPGDNFKIVATTNPTLVNSLTISGQRILNGTVVLAQQPDPGQPAIAAAEAVTSRLLTVWRKLHVEVDSMFAPSTSSGNPNSNSVSGEIRSITSRGNDVELGLYEPNTNNLANPIDLRALPNGQIDRSPNLSGANNPIGDNEELGNGRFENGIITIGNATQPVIINPLIGNGTNFVKFRETNTNRISFTLTDAANANALTGTVQELNFIIRQFTLNRNIGANYVGGILTVAGTVFHVTNVDRRNVTVMETPSLPVLRLIDDDTATTPFLIGENDPAFGLMRDSNITTMNLFAKAYLRPIYDIPVTNTGFVRNYRDATQITQRIDMDQSTKASGDYWLVYLQGAFQGSVFTSERHRASQIIEEQGDADPLSEIARHAQIRRFAVLGETPIETVLDMSGAVVSRRRLGTVIYMETLADQARNSGFDCKTITTAHEVGHQFDIEHRDPDNPNIPESDIRLGIMAAVCGQATIQEFIASHIKLIRNSQQPQKRSN